MEDTLAGKDVDDDLSRLEAEVAGVAEGAKGAAGDAARADEVAKPGDRPKSGPPPLSKARARRPASGAMPSGEWRGRTRFDELFRHADGPAWPAAGGPEERLEYLREKLKQSEALVLRVKQAWETREQELDALEQQYLRQSAKLEEIEQRASQAEQSALRANETTAALQAFIQKKREELEAYGQSAAKVLAAQQESERRVRAELDELRRATEEERTELVEQHRGTLRELTTKNDTLSKYEALVAGLKKRLVEREEELEALRDEVATSSEEVAKNRAQDGQAQEEIDKRDALIERQKALLNETRARIDELQAGLELKNNELFEATDRMHLVAQELAETRDSLARAREELKAARERARESNTQLTDTRQKLESKQLELASAARATPEPAFTQSDLERLTRTLAVVQKLQAELNERSGAVADDLYERFGAGHAGAEELVDLLARQAKAIEILARVLR